MLPTSNQIYSRHRFSGLKYLTSVDLVGSRKQLVMAPLPCIKCLYIARLIVAAEVGYANNCQQVIVKWRRFRERVLVEHIVLPGSLSFCIRQELVL